MSAYKTPLRAPKTPDYCQSVDHDMDLFPDPNLGSEPEEMPPASQLEPRHKTELAKQCNNKGKHFAQENNRRNSQSIQQPRKRKHNNVINALEFKKQKTENSKLKVIPLYCIAHPYSV